MPLPFMLSEGNHLDYLGNLISSIYVDFRHPTNRRPISTLVKGCPAQYAMEATDRIRISKPKRFRDTGESLIRDPNEARPKRIQVIHESIDEPRDLARARQRDQAMNRASQLVGAKEWVETTSIRRTYSEGQSLSVGKNAWIFCTSIEPSNLDEWEQWRQSLEDDYNHVSYIYRPRAFARELASMAADHLGPPDQQASLTHSFEGQPTLSTEHPRQLLFHGPVIYVDDVYSLIESAKSKHEFILLPLFAKDETYKALREYRFIIWNETETAELFEDLPISPAMKGFIGEGKKDTSPQRVLDSEYMRVEFAPTERDTAKKDDPSSEFDEESCNELGRSLIDANSLEAELFRTFSRANEPATVYKPHKITPDDLPDNIQAMTAIYPSVRALQNKVRDFLEIDEDSSERRLGVTSAAWYAEQDIRELCQTFDDPISGISISPDGFIVIHVSLSDRPEIECELAVAPSGESVMRLAAPRRQSTQRRDYKLPRRNIAQSVRDFVDQLAKDAAVLGRKDASEDVP